jgi:hypothetical protein
MSEAMLTTRTSFERGFDGLLGLGRPIFAAAIVAFGVETVIVARSVSHPLGPQYSGLAVIPWLPAIPWVAYLFGAIWVACGAGSLAKRTLRTAALVLGILLFVCALILEVPANLANIGDIGLRTVVFEPLAIASLAWLLPGPGAHAALPRAREPLPAWIVSDRLWNRPLSRDHIYRFSDPGLDSMARVLGCILRRRIHCGRLEHRH